MELKLSWRYLFAFLLLTILCGTSHEFVHHFVAALLCGCFGHKTFNSFGVCAACADNKLVVVISTLAGPVFTFGLLWYGAWLLQQPDERRKQLGFALIFANFPINRLFFVLLNMNDEQFANRLWLGRSGWVYWVTVFEVYLAGVPPLVIAYRAIANRWRPLWFTGFFVLPFAYVILFAGLFLENFLLVKQKFLAREVIGIPYLILLVEVLCLAGYWTWQRYLWEEARAPEPVLGG